MLTGELHGGMDMIDSRDVIERIAELTDLREEDGDEEVISKDEREELGQLLSLKEDASDSPDWEYGETLIRDGYFLNYAMQLAEDIGAVPSSIPWPMSHIDWNAAAEALKQDYFYVNFDGDTYWIRA